jgi:hypothetical protein
MGPRSRRAACALLLFLVVGGFYALTFDFRASTDSYLNSLQTRALVLHGDIDLARYGNLSGFVVHKGSHEYSVYGAGVTLFGAPVYVLTSRLGASDRLSEELASIPFVAASVVLLFFLLLKLFDRSIAAAGTIVYASGTTIWPIGATAFWQHGPVALMSILGLHAVFSDREDAPLWAGLALGAATFIRPPLIVVTGTLALYYASKGWKSLTRYFIGGVPAIAAFAIQGRWLWGSWTKGGYSFSGIGFHGNIARALFGELFSFWRGLFVYSPVLILAGFGAVLALTRRKPLERRLVFLSLACVSSIVLYARFSTWWGGKNQFGYRYLLDITPILVLLAAYAVQRLPKLRTIGIPLAITSILTMTFGSAPNRFGWDFNPFPKSFVDSPIGQAWIAFFDRPGPGLLRLAAVGAVAAVLVITATRVGARPSVDPAAVADTV